MPPSISLRSCLRVSTAVLLGAVLAGCAGMRDTMPGLERHTRFDPDDFDTASMHTRHINAPQSQACEAARRALLSQGYLVNTATDEVVAGRKYFQPSTDIHYEVEMRVVCAPEGNDNQHTAAFASALQDRYVIKKINNSASLGVGALGSVSLPVSASDDTLVKVGSETVTDPRFYERFFQLFDRYVRPAPAQQVGVANVLPTPVSSKSPVAPAAAADPTASASTVPMQEREAVGPSEVDDAPPRPAAEATGQ